MGGGGEGGGMEMHLSTGALEAMSREDGLRPVLQLADAPRMVADSAGAERYRVVLSDGGAHLQLGMLATSLNHLVARGALRRGTVVRVLEYFAGFIHNQRVIIVIQLEILQSECELIRSPTIFEANATQHIGLSCSGSVAILEPCFMLGAQQVVRDSSCSPSQGLLDSSIIPREERTVNNLPFSECVCSMPAQSTVDAKMQQLSLNDNQNQRFTVTATGDVFGSHGNSNGSPMPPSYLHSAPMCVDRSHVNQNESCITPVSALSPYQARWKIKARVTAKTDLKHFTSNRGLGKVFTFDLLDAQGGEIRAVCFNLQADQYFNLIEVGKVYLIYKGSLKPAQKKFNPFNNDFEILVDHTTSIQICCDDESSFPRQQYNFRQISEIENMEIGAFVDLVGIVTSVGPSAIMMRKDGTEAQKRTLQLKDMSVRSVEIILWGKFCDAEGHQLQLLCDSGSNPILSLKGGRVSDFNGRSVVTISSTQLKVNPDFPVAERLKQWYVTEGKNTACISLSQEISNMSKSYVLKTIAQIKDENLGRSDKPDLITVRAVVSYVGADKFCYQACTLELNGKRCNKKVTENVDGTWRCDRCNQNTENCEYRYLSCQIKDHTGTVYTTAFQEAGEAIFGHTAQELFRIRNIEHNGTRFKEIMESVLCREYLFKLRIKQETYNGEPRVNCCIVGVKKLEEMDNHSKDVSRPILKDYLSYTPNVDSANLEAMRQSMLNYINGYGCATSVGATGVGATGYGHLNGMSTPPSASSEDLIVLCFRCSQPGHWARDCLV